MTLNGNQFQKGRKRMREIINKWDYKMDVYKGLLVFGMILCHVLQFFVDLSVDRTADYITWYINSVTFSGFVFSFGYTGYIAYFSRRFSQVYIKMLFVFTKLLIAFYISGIAFRVFVSNQRISYDMVINIFVLNDIPGWSEFILSFALYIIVGIVLFKPIKNLIEKKKIFWFVTGSLLLTTFIPYESVPTTQLGLIVGSTEFAAFPVIQYMPFYLMGIYFKRHEVGFDWVYLMLSVILSGVGIIYMGFNGFVLPNRFPPNVFWIILPCAPLYLYMFISKALLGVTWVRRKLIRMGQNSIVYLLLSNIIVFAVDGTKGISNLTYLTGILANILLIGIITYLLSMCRDVKYDES